MTRPPHRQPLLATVASVVLAACAADLPPPASTGTPPVQTPQGVLTGPLQVRVHDRAVELRWEEDEFLHHCLTISQPRVGKKPLELVFCPGKDKPAQTTVTIGDTPGQGGVDFAWTATDGLVHGDATWVLRGGQLWGVTPTEVAQGTLRVGPHFNGPCQSAGAQATGLQEWHATGPVTLDVQVELGTAARSQVDVSTPEIWIDSISAKGSPMAGGTLSFSYTFDTPGMYTVEVNNTGGGAILNCAVYVGAAIPLVPVEVKGGAGLTADPDPSQLATLRGKILALTNQERASVGLGPLVLDDDLNEIAQYHSDNMASQGFFGHTDPQGLGPGERAKKFGFQGPVGENLASNTSIEGAHNGLYWSAAHRSNMLGKDWGRVGFGIAKDAKGKNLLVTENFSTAAP